MICLGIRFYFNRYYLYNRKIIEHDDITEIISVVIAGTKSINNDTLNEHFFNISNTFSKFVPLKLKHFYLEILKNQYYQMSTILYIKVDIYNIII